MVEDLDAPEIEGFVKVFDKSPVYFVDMVTVTLVAVYFGDIVIVAVLCYKGLAIFLNLNVQAK